MKRWLLLLLTLGIITTAGCSAGKPEVSGTVSEISSESIAEEEKDMDGEVRELFAGLRESDMICIDAEMTVEETDRDKNVYRYVMAADKKEKTAVLDMKQPDGMRTHCIIREHTLYTLDDEEKTYQAEEYKGTIEDFVKAYTKDIELTDSMSLADSGTTDFNGRKEMEFARYRVAVESGSDNITVTYYWQDDKPYAEVMQSDHGKTTFLFSTLTDRIADKSILQLPEDYEEI